MTGPPARSVPCMADMHGKPGGVQTGRLCWPATLRFFRDEERLWCPGSVALDRAAGWAQWMSGLRSLWDYVVQLVRKQVVRTLKAMRNATCCG